MRSFRSLCGIAILGLLVGGIPSHASTKSAAVAAVNARDDLYTRGSQQQDLKLLSSVWADSFIDTSGTGIVRNKQQMLAVIAAAKKAGQKILSIAITDRRTMIYGNAAVVTGMFTTTVSQNAQSQTFKGRFTDVWIKQGNTWNCVAAHSSPIK